MAKKIDAAATPEAPYVNEDAAPKQSWIKTKQGKLVAAIAGGVVILGGTFATGVAVGEHRGGDLRGQFGQAGFGDRDGDHGGFQPGGPKGFNGGQFNPNQPPMPQPNQQGATPGTQNNGQTTP